MYLFHYMVFNFLMYSGWKHLKPRVSVICIVGHHNKIHMPKPLFVNKTRDKPSTLIH